MDKDAITIIEQVVKQAQAIARKQGLSIRDVVAHPDDKLTYWLINIDGDTANVWIPAEYSPTGQEVKKQFPLNELFKPSVACDLAVQLVFMPTQ